MGSGHQMNQSTASLLSPFPSHGWLSSALPPSSVWAGSEPPPRASSGLVLQLGRVHT